MSISPAQRLDLAVDSLLAGAPATVEPGLRPLIDVAAAVHVALPPVLPGASFEEHLSRRLHALALGGARPLLSANRLLLTGAASAVGVAGVAAFAFWRATRR